MISSSSSSPSRSRSCSEWTRPSSTSTPAAGVFNHLRSLSAPLSSSSAPREHAQWQATRDLIKQTLFSNPSRVSSRFVHAGVFLCISICFFPDRITKWCCEIRRVLRQVLLQLSTGTR
nr:uncharacterized protein LOC127293181 isoform X2 [Lolium perenne]